MARNHQPTGKIKTRNHRQKKRWTRDHKHKGARRAMETRNNHLKVEKHHKYGKDKKEKKAKNDKKYNNASKDKKEKKGKDAKKAKSEE